MSEAVVVADDGDMPDHLEKPKKRVLVIDDDKQVSRLVGRALTRSDEFQVSTVAEPGIGLLKAKQEQFDVIVSDLSMPGMDGLELLRGIRTFDLDIPIILLTGTPSIETAQKALELGAFRYLTKPFQAEELVDLCKQASFAHRIARLKRQAFELSGAEDLRPGDLAGITEAFDSTLETLGIVYQPIVHAGSGKLYGYEALMRSKNKKLPYPSSVLHAAEHLNRVFDLGRVIRRLAAAPFADLSGETKLFLNLHPRDLMDENLSSRSSAIGGIADRVVLEITERESLERVPQVQRKLDELRSMGFKIAVDDLGAGYAGLSSFASLSPDIVKLDMSLIQGIHESEVKRKIVASMVETCHDLEIGVVAEGVETLAELQVCQKIGCDYLQGYYIARPGEVFPVINWQD
ncbi:MAG: EAL domain-containing protein [Gammaproteobacteria bacterium]